MRKTANKKLNLLDDNDVFDYNYVNENNEIIDKELENLSDKNSDTVYATGVNNTFVVKSDEPLTSYYKSLKRIVFFDKDWTGTGTINFDGLGAKYIKDSYGNVVTNLKKDIPYHVCYNGQDFILLGKGGGGNAEPWQVLEPNTFTNDKGTQKGIMKDNGTKIFTPGRNNIAIPEGYHNGQGYIKGDSNLIPENIANGVTIFGTTGISNVKCYKQGVFNIAVGPYRKVNDTSSNNNDKYYPYDSTKIQTIQTNCSQIKYLIPITTFSGYNAGQSGKTGDIITVNSDYLESISFNVYDARGTSSSGSSYSYSLSWKGSIKMVNKSGNIEIQFITDYIVGDASVTNGEKIDLLIIGH